METKTVTITLPDLDALAHYQAPAWALLVMTLLALAAKIYRRNPDGVGNAWNAVGTWLWTHVIASNWLAVVGPVLVAGGWTILSDTITAFQTERAALMSEHPELHRETGLPMTYALSITGLCMATMFQLVQTTAVVFNRWFTTPLRRYEA